MTVGSSGGSAAAGGFRFETQVAALLAVYAVAEQPLPTEFPNAPWPRAAGWPTHVGLETGYRVDDVGAFTQAAGLIVVQAKKGLRLGPASASPLAEALRQAVRMFRVGRRSGGGDEAAQDWNPGVDRIVIATDAGAPQAVREHLAKVVARWATAPPVAGEDQLATNESERKALGVFAGHLGRLWEQETGAAITAEEIRSFCSVVRIAGLDLLPAGRDWVTVSAVLASVLVDPTQTNNAWHALLVACQDLAAERRFATSEELRGILAAAGIGVRTPEHRAGEVEPVFAPEAVLRGPLATGEFRDRVTDAEARMTTDPGAAAKLYASVMAELQARSFSHVAARLQPKLARALRASGQHQAAVRAAVSTAWRPICLGEVPPAFSDAWPLEQELRGSPGVASRSGLAVLAVLLYEAGEQSLADVADQIARLEGGDEHAGELVLWLAEEAIAGRQPELFIPLSTRATRLADAASGEAAEFAGRLRIAVADCTQEWDALLATIEADCGAPLYVLAQARHGQALARRNEFAEAISSYEEAIDRGIRERMYTEVHTWLYDVRTLRAALLGPGALGHDPHFTAQSLPAEHKVSVFAGEQRLLARGLEALGEGKHGRAHSIFMRLRHRMAAGAALSAQRRCEAHRGAALAAAGNPNLAMACYLRAGDHKSASSLVRQQPDAPLVSESTWDAGPVWEFRAAYEFLGDHGDLVPEANARRLFDDLAGRLVTSGSIQGWSNFQANEVLLKPLAALVWASSEAAAARLLEQTAPLAERGGVGHVIEAHVDLVLGCARVHPGLIPQAALQFGDLISASERAIPAAVEYALELLAPAWDDLTEQLVAKFGTGTMPWLAPVLVELGVRLPTLVDHVNTALDRAATPREYQPNTMSFGSDVVDVARLSVAGDADRCHRFVAAMLDLAFEARESYSGRREAIDAIAVVAQQRGVASLGDSMLTKIRSAMRRIVAGEGAASAKDDFATPWTGSPTALILAASRLLLILSDNDDERGRLVRTLLLTLMDQQIDTPRLLSNALAQASAEHFQQDLLVLATSRSPAIRALAAHRWAELPSADLDIGRRLAADPVGTVRHALAHSLNRHPRPGTEDIRKTLTEDSRFTVRAKAQPRA